ncbi:hypothetical protein BJX70DRAFT_371370 [Aspergillus crustosus]
MPMSTEAVVGIVAVFLAVIPIGAGLLKIWRKGKSQCIEADAESTLPMWKPKDTLGPVGIPPGFQYCDCYCRTAMLFRVNTVYFDRGSSASQTDVVICFG